MGGHGGLNILPQKRWNVYNYNNRERVRKDKEKYREWQENHERKITNEKLARKREELRRETIQKEEDELPRSQISIEIENTMKEQPAPAPGEKGFCWKDKKKLPEDGFAVNTKATREVPWYAQPKNEASSCPVDLRRLPL